MEERAEWRALLDSIIRTRAEREHIASQVGVTAVTLTRWASGESSPRQQNLRLLIQAIPLPHRAAFRALLEEDPQAFSQEEASHDDSEQGIPYGLISTVLATRATGSPLHVSWVIIRQILHHALLHLDPSHLGMKITIAQCMPPGSGGKISSLLESFGLGTPPWRNHFFEEHAQFLGVETLAGYAVTTARVYQIPDLRTDPMLLPSAHTEHEVSAAACPIMWQGRVAGCLLFTSTQVGAFASSKQSGLLEDYANLLALAFAEEDFSPMKLIQLQVMPSAEVQQPALAGFRQQVMLLMKESAAMGRPLTSTEAEQRAWQLIEAYLLH